MEHDPEPTVNISGGTDGGGKQTSFDPSRADTRAAAIVDELGRIYWQKTYGGQDAFPCLIRTILSQNTSDVASQPAFDALVDRYGSAGQSDDTQDRLAVSLANADRETLAETIKSAGLYNQKSAVIQNVSEWILAEFGSERAFDDFVTNEALEAVRQTLLDVRGIGPKTADCVCLFAGGKPGVFPVDTHVHRIFRRFGVAPPDADHETVRHILERDVPGEKCGFGHTASIQFGRDYCTSRSPVCLDGLDACPLADRCDRVGVSPEMKTVVDPASESS